MSPLETSFSVTSGGAYRQHLSNSGVDRERNMGGIVVRAANEKRAEWAENKLVRQNTLQNRKALLALEHTVTESPRQGQRIAVEPTPGERFYFEDEPSVCMYQRGPSRCGAGLGASGSVVDVTAAGAGADAVEQWEAHPVAPRATAPASPRSPLTPILRRRAHDTCTWPSSASKEQPRTPPVSTENVPATSVLAARNGQGTEAATTAPGTAGPPVPAGSITGRPRLRRKPTPYAGQMLEDTEDEGTRALSAAESEEAASAAVMPTPQTRADAPAHSPPSSSCPALIALPASGGAGEKEQRLAPPACKGATRAHAGIVASVTS